jgi:hypothetical protein
MVTLLLFFVLPVSLKAKHLVAIFIAISLFSGIQGQVFGISDGVAHLAHLGGALVGAMMLRWNVSLSMVARKIRQQQEKRKTHELRRKEESIKKMRDEIDRVLDRINQVGYDGITDEEKKFLKDASDFLSRQ